MKILVTGASGMLGKDIAVEFSKISDNVVYALYRNNRPQLETDNIVEISLDLCHTELLLEKLELIEPDLIVHCAAIVNVDQCENDKILADNLHVDVSTLFARYTNITGSKMVYISTDSVFDGETGNYREEDVTGPLNYYALSKFNGELATLGENKESNNLVVRGNIFGFHTPRATSLVEWALREMEQNKIIAGFDDVYFNPLYTKQFAKAIVDLLSLQVSGIIHLGSDACVSKYEFLVNLAHIFQVYQHKIEKKSVSEVFFAAKRPRNTCLNTDLASQLFGKKISFSEGLTALYRDYIAYC